MSESVAERNARWDAEAQAIVDATTAALLGKGKIAPCQTSQDLARAVLVLLDEQAEVARRQREIEAKDREQLDELRRARF